MNNKKNLLRSVAAKLGYSLALTGLISTSAYASMGNIGSTYGILPTDIGTAQAFSLFNSQTSAVYYNPAYLTKDPRGELTLGIMHAEHELKRDGKVLSDTPSQHVLVGMKTDLSSLTQFDHPMYFGVIVGIEEYSQEMMAFTSSTSSDGQFLEYGRQPLFLAMGGGAKLIRGVSAGFSMRVTLHADSILSSYSSLGGTTDHEDLEVSAKQKLSPIFGVNIDWGEFICGSRCFLKGLETSAVFRRYSNTQTTVDAGVVIPGTIQEPGMALVVTTLDSYQPNVFAAGIQYGREKSFRIGASVEFQEWSRLEEELASDTMKDQAILDAINPLKFRDIIVPRVGAEVWLGKHLMLTSGAAWMRTPMESYTSVDVNYFDNDKIVVGAGLALEFDKAYPLAFPLRIDAGYQYQHLLDRKFDMYNSTTNDPANSEPQYTGTVKAGGTVHVFSGSITLKF